jgi:hypothetical protein
MSAVLENLFTQAGIGANLHEETACLPNEEGTAAHPPVATTPEPAAAPHPAASLQQRYVQTILVHQELLRMLAKADAIGAGIGYSCGWREHNLDFYGIHRDAVHKLVMSFKAWCMKGDASVDPKNEFEDAFGEKLTEEIYASGRYYHRDRDEKREHPENIRIDLVKLWDALAKKYADGGMRLERSQAAAVILSDWPLRDKPFQVVNGKAVIEDRVWSEKNSFRGYRHLTYSSSQSVARLLKALNVFLDFADLECDAVKVFFGDTARTEPEITSGRRYVVAKGQVEFKTFNDYWRWTLSEDTANKLREFLAEYGHIARD